MITNRRELAQDAAATALKIRRQLQIPLNASLSPCDAAERLGIEVRLVDLPSIEGMYIAGPTPKIILSALRPPGRRNFSCAHEIGHHVFGHGEQFDEMADDRSWRRKNDPVEFVADCFASYFLMPKTTVDSGVASRGWTYEALSASQTYALSNWLGSSYQALVNHLRYGLGVITHAQSQRLSTAPLKNVRTNLAGRSMDGSLHIVDQFWTGRAIDCEVNDFIMTPLGILCEGERLELIESLATGVLWRALTPGIGRLSNAALPWSAFVRVSRSRYIGRACFRYEEEVEE